MPLHFTYDRFARRSDLEQGDIIVPSDELTELVARTHLQFGSPECLGYIVTTQSCDLVRVKSRQPVGQINLAAVRSLSEILPDLLNHACDQIAPGVYEQKERSRAESLLRKILNQNEQKLGLFYLFPDPTLKLGEDAVAMLRDSVVVDAKHYKLLMNSRTGRLRNAFANKLGWLVGNMYSKVGTEDFTERDPAAAKQVIKSYLSPEEGSPFWMRDGIRQYLERNGIDPRTMNPDELVGVAERLPSPKQVAIDEIVAIVQEVYARASENQIRRLTTKLKNSQPLSQQFKRA